MNNNIVGLPRPQISISLTLASEAMEEFKKANTLNERIKHAQVIVGNIRKVDTAYHRYIADILNKNNHNKPNICEHCIRGKLFNTNLKEYRKNANKNIIHKMEDMKGGLITEKDLEVVELYYDEIFKLQFIYTIHIPAMEGVPLCDKCKEKWKKFFDQS